MNLPATRLTPKHREMLDSILGEGTYDEALDWYTEARNLLAQYADIGRITGGVGEPWDVISLHTEAGFLRKIAIDYDSGLAKFAGGERIVESQIDALASVYAIARDVVTRRTGIAGAMLLGGAWFLAGRVLERQIPFLTAEAKRAEIDLIALDKALKAAIKAASTPEQRKALAKLGFDVATTALAFVFPQLGYMLGLALAVASWKGDAILGRSSALDGGVGEANEWGSRLSVGVSAQHSAVHTKAAMDAYRKAGLALSGVSIAMDGLDIVKMGMMGSHKDNLARSLAACKMQLAQLRSRLVQIEPSLQAWLNQNNVFRESMRIERAALESAKQELESLALAARYSMTGPVVWRSN
jgi:hypothetical protein